MTKIKLSAHKLALTISEVGVVKATITKRVVTHTGRKGHRVTKVTYRTLKTVTLAAAKAGSVNRKWTSALPRGTYRVKLRAADLAGNVSSRTVHPHLT